MKGILVLVGDAGVEVGVSLVPGGRRRPPAEEAGDAVDVGVDGEALAAEAEEEHAAGGLGADAAEGDELAHGVVVAGGEQVIEGVGTVARVRLLQDGEDDAALDGGEPSTLDSSLQPLLTARRDRLPLVTASVLGVHAPLRSCAVCAACVLA